MWMHWLIHISMYGMLSMMVMALTSVTFAWLGGFWGVLMGQLYIILAVLHLDLNLIQGPLDLKFYVLFVSHVIAVNLLLLPAWILGLLLRQMQSQPKQPPR
jgi:hypothetical protein